MKKIKDMFRSVSSRYGAYSTLLVVVVIAIVIMVNMVAGQFPKNWRNIDLSSNNLYEITDQSKALLKSLDKKVELHVLADKATADERIQLFIEKYAGLSSKVSVKWTDPVLHPTVLTSNNAKSNTIIVSCQETGKSMQIGFDEMVTYDEMAYYSYGSYVETGFDAEGQLTSAVNYVVNDATQKIYVTTGHGEVAVSATLTDLMEKSNYTTEEINTLMSNEIPEDCSLLFLNAPLADLSADEKTLISAYMQKGGDVVLVLGDGQSATPNLDALMVEYGLTMVDGYIADMKNSNQQNPFLIYPELKISDQMAVGLNTKMILLANARGMESVTPARDTITVEELMTTSDKGVAVTETAQKEGTYILGAVATESESRFTVISAWSMIDESLAGMSSSIENNTLFMNVVSSNFEEGSNVAIEPKSLEIEYNTMKHVGVSTLVVVFGIPAVILIYGFVNWMKRRKA